MKFFKTMFLIVTFFFCIQNNAFSDSTEYETNGQVGFYGEYIYETEETTEKKEIVTPSKSKKERDKKIVERIQDKLPATGEKRNDLYPCVGTILVTFFLFSFYVIKEKRNEN